MEATTRRGLDPVRQPLDNDAVVLVKETRTTPAVTISVAVSAGGIYEREDRLGLANFLSRVIDRGTAHRAAEEIAEGLDARGVTLSTAATRHSVLLSCTCLSEDFDFILRLLGEVVTEPTIPAEEVEKRRAEIVTSIRQDLDSPAAVAVEGLFGLLYPDGHPYGRPAKGRIASVERIDRVALQDFHAARFAPANTSIVIVGDVTGRRAMDAAAAVFGGWRVPTVAPAPLAPPPLADRRRQTVVPMMNKSQADIAYGFTTITRSDPRHEAFTLMNCALGQYALGGRLGESIRERQGMAYYVFSSFEGTVVEGPLVIRAGVSPANVERALASIDAEVARIALEGPTAGELADCKRFLVGSMPRMLETNAGIARFLQTVEFFGLGADYDVRLPAALEAVPLDEVRAAAATLSPDRAAVAVAGPYQAERDG